MRYVALRFDAFGQNSRNLIMTSIPMYRRVRLGGSSYRKCSPHSVNNPDIGVAIKFAPPKIVQLWMEMPITITIDRSVPSHLDFVEESSRCIL